MKVLQINKFLYPKGGAETYLLGLSELLAQNGHEVIFFSQKNPQNIQNNQEKYFIKDINLEKFSVKNIFSFLRIFWCFSASRKIKKLIKDEKPDIAHIHNIYHQISPSILPALKKAGVPIVMTVHDFKLVKHDYTLRATHQVVRHKNSFWADLILKLEFNFHRRLKIYQKNIDLFIAPSNFVKDQLIKAGFAANKIQVAPHFINLEKYPQQADQPQDYILSFGRLDESKGLDLLLKAFARIENPGLKLKIAGAGQEKENLEKLAQELGLAEKVEFLGRQNKEELIRLIGQSLFAVFPSRVHETFGLGVLETLAGFRPVIATNVGAFPEIVNENTGIIVAVENIGELKQAIEFLAKNRQKIKEMGQNGRIMVEKEFNAQNHYQKVINIYQALDKKGKIC